MKYTVTWRQEAQDAMTRIWLASRSRYVLTVVIASLERSLSADPESMGESRSGRLRIIMLDPLIVWVRVSLDDRLVEVVGARLMRGGSNL